jgi:hypothetical protein
LGVAASAVVLAACSVNVPDPAAEKPSPVESTVAAPTITPGHDADAVAAKDLPLSAGSSLVPGDPVSTASKLQEAPGWSLVHAAMQGEDRYKKSDGCVAVTRVAVNQGPLVEPGNDEASTKAMFQYMDPGVDAGRLKPVNLRWGQDADKPPRKVELLALESSAASGGTSALVLGRLFSGPASSVFVSVNCLDDAALAKARADVESSVALVPPA